MASTWVGIEENEEKIVDKHITQLSSSGCGATAIVNLLILFNLIDKSSVETIDWSKCILRTRANDASIFPYLLSRYNAGCTGEELIESMSLLLEANKTYFNTSRLPHITGRFYNYQTIKQEGFSTIIEFLSHHLSTGGIPVATLNLQILGNDAWHHQIVHGVNFGNKSIHVLNPLDSYPEVLFEKFISTESVLLIRRNDVLSRLTPEVHEYCTRLPSQVEILTLENNGSQHQRIFGKYAQVFLSPPWNSFPILQQISAMIHDPDIAYLLIPGAYKGGVAIFRSI